MYVRKYYYFLTVELGRNKLRGIPPTTHEEMPGIYITVCFYLLLLIDGDYTQFFISYGLPKRSPARTCVFNADSIKGSVAVVLVPIRN